MVLDNHLERQSRQCAPCGQAKLKEEKEEELEHVQLLLPNSPFKYLTPPLETRQCTGLRKARCVRHEVRAKEGSHSPKQYETVNVKANHYKNLDDHIITDDLLT